MRSMNHEDSLLEEAEASSIYIHIYIYILHTSILSNIILRTHSQKESLNTLIAETNWLKTLLFYIIDTRIFIHFTATSRFSSPNIRQVRLRSFEKPWASFFSSHNYRVLEISTFLWNPIDYNPKWQQKNTLFYSKLRLTNFVFYWLPFKAWNNETFAPTN